jgi:hypothetical protein
MPKLNPWLRVFTPREDLRKNRPVDTSEGRSGPPSPGYDLPPLRGSNQLPRRLVRTESADPAVLCDLRSPSPRPLARHLETYGRSNGGVWRPSPNEPYRFTPHAPRPTPHAPGRGFDRRLSLPENRCGVDAASGSIAADRTRSTWPEPSQPTWRNLTSSTIPRGRHRSGSPPRPAQNHDPGRWYRPYRIKALTAPEAGSGSGSSWGPSFLFQP